MVIVNLWMRPLFNLPLKFSTYACNVYPPLIYHNILYYLKTILPNINFISLSNIFIMQLYNKAYMVS